jgi:hypothetical protein
MLQVTAGMFGLLGCLARHGGGGAVHLSVTSEPITPMRAACRWGQTG